MILLLLIACTAQAKVNSPYSRFYGNFTLIEASSLDACTRNLVSERDGTAVWVRDAEGMSFGVVRFDHIDEGKLCNPSDSNTILNLIASGNSITCSKTSLSRDHHKITYRRKICSGEAADCSLFRTAKDSLTLKDNTLTIETSGEYSLEIASKCIYTRTSPAKNH